MSAVGETPPPSGLFLYYFGVEIKCVGEPGLARGAPADAPR